VVNRHPGITPNNPAPAEGENSEVFETVELPDGAPEDLPTDIFEAKTKKWTQPKPKKIGVKVIRMAKLMAETFAEYSLSKVTRGEEERKCEDDINERIKKLRGSYVTRTVGGKRKTIVSERQQEQMAQLEAQMRRIKQAKTKKGVKADNPTLKEAMSRNDWPKFKKAIDEELNQIAVGENAHEAKATLPQDLPKGANVIGSMLVLTVKRRPDGTIDKYKARLVAFGNHQKATSYEQVKAGTVRGSTVKMLVSLQAKTRAFSMVLDVKGAYLKSVIKEPNKEKLYIRYPDGRVFKLLKYIYGLKQAGYEWQQNITGTLITWIQTVYS
jgi:Reverse transcriptase (RNA-dependent DNA polymerase)